MTDFYRKKSDLLNQYKTNQSVIVNKKYLPNILNVRLPPKSVPKLPSVDWYPATNSFYPFSEDVDIYSRVNHVLSTDRASETLRHQIDCQTCACIEDSYAERDAQTQYLTSTPTSFLILGKPGIGQEQLGKLLAEYWKCVYVEPEILILEEIENGSEAGNCIEFNLRNGRSISADTVMRLLEKRVKSKTAQHRGFVVCGFPLVPNDLFEEELLTTDSTLFNVREVCADVLEIAVELGVPPESKSSRVEVFVSDEEAIEEEVLGEGEDYRPPSTRVSDRFRTPLDLGSEVSHVCVTGKYENDCEEQLKLVFSQFRKPFIVIYVICENDDVIVKHKNHMFDVYSRQEVDLVLEEADKIIYTYFSQMPADVDEVPEDFIDIVKNSNAGFNSHQQRQLVSLPKNWSENVVTVLNRYRRTALPTVEHHLLRHELENVIRVDGRISPVRMFHAIKQRLSVMPLQRVLVPERFDGRNEVDAEGGQQALNLDKLSPEECLGLLVRKQVPSTMFKWSLSDWRFKCPVMLKSGVEREGDPNYAVHFMNKIFFLADEECYVKFKRNPRAFLLPYYPKPIYKFCVMGHRCAGKSSVAKCLGYLFNYKVIKYERLLADFFNNMVAEYESEVRANALERALEELNKTRAEEWEEKEAARLEAASSWTNSLRDVLLKIAKLREAIAELAQKETCECPEIHKLHELLMKEIELVPVDADLEELLVDDGKLDGHLPHELQPDDGPIPATPTDEFVLDYVKEALANASYAGIELTIENKIDVLLEAIRNAEEEGECAGCWIVDGMLPIRDLFEALHPDHTPVIVVALVDDDHQYLPEMYPQRGHADYNKYKKLFCDIDKEDVGWRTLSTTESYKERTTRQVLEQLIDDAIETADPEQKLATLEEYVNELKAFDEEFDETQPLLREQGIDVIVVSVTEKSIDVVLKEVVRLVENRYGPVASIFTDLDRAQELEDIGDHDVQSEEAVDAEEKGDGEDLVLQCRQYGDTFNYCPVVFHDHFVLWKGKDEFTVKFDNKVYMLSSESAMSKFLMYPRHYLPGNKPPDECPPPRMCVVGPCGSGRSTVGDYISKNLGVYHYKFDNLLKKLIAPKTRLSLYEVIKYGIGGADTVEVQEYLSKGRPLQDHYLMKILGPLWFGEYEKIHGFILSGFPKYESDVAFMIKYCTVPDIVVELSINQGEIRNRLFYKCLGDLENVDESVRREEILTNWEEQYERRFRELLYVKKTEELNAMQLSEIEEESEVVDELESEATVAEVKKLLDSEMPKPAFPKKPEPLEKKIEACVNAMEIQSANDLAHLADVRDTCHAEVIPWKTVDAGLPKPNVFAQVMRLVEDLKLRNRSVFERVYEISEDMSEKLLSTGYYFLSKFGKTCPVQVLENCNRIQMYLPSKQHFQLCPVVHRQYVYFLAKRESLMKFRQNPLKYVMQCYVHEPLLPLRVAVIGPPKSGKTTLAERFKRDLGMQVVSRGKSCRYVLTYLRFTEVAEQMEALLRTGEELPDDIVMRAVESCTFDGRCLTQGFVFDGFPETVNEVRLLTAMGLTPHLVFDLRADLDTVLEFRDNIVEKGSFPVFSRAFIDCRYQVHMLHAEEFSCWLDKEYQNNARLLVKQCKWGAWDECYRLTLAAIYEIKHYHRYAFHDYVLRLSYMQVTPLEFLQRQSSYRQYCPCCLLFDYKLRNGGHPPDRTGLVQFRRFFYYLCREHIELFIKDPEPYISPYNRRDLPFDLPVRVSSFLAEPYAKGKCVICYWTNKPLHVVNAGNENMAVLYRNTIYLFDTEECLQKFMEQPHLYFAIKMSSSVMSDDFLSLKDLPVPGFLQQYDALKLIKAITNTIILRPVIPGLGIATSACLNIGLHMMVNNPNVVPEYRPLYKEAQQKFHERRLKLINSLAQMKSMINPFLYYDEIMPKFVDPLLPESYRCSSTTAVSSVSALEEGDENEQNTL